MNTDITCFKADCLYHRQWGKLEYCDRAQIKIGIKRKCLDFKKKDDKETD